MTYNVFGGTLNPTLLLLLAVRVESHMFVFMKMQVAVFTQLASPLGLFSLSTM